MYTALNSGLYLETRCTSFNNLECAPKPVRGTAAPQETTHPRPVRPSPPSVENHIIAAIVRFPSALPTTKSGDPGGHLSVYRLCFIPNELRSKRAQSRSPHLGAPFFLFFL